MNLKKSDCSVSSVGADGKHHLVIQQEKIADLPQKGNLQATESCPTESKNAE